MITDRSCSHFFVSNRSCAMKKDGKRKKKATTPRKQTLVSPTRADIEATRKAGETTKPSSWLKWLRRKNDDTVLVLKTICDQNANTQKEVLEQLVSQKFSGLINWNAYVLDVDACLAIRQEVAGRGMSTNSLYRALDAISKLTDQKGLFPTQLKVRGKGGVRLLVMTDILNTYHVFNSAETNTAKRARMVCTC
jgi:hypothetical protein